ncbi:MAG: flavin reductase family protein [Pseudomonadota bacterium]|nr:flavin reductase family protein [Pseudomonadota bacterium]
MLFDLDTLETPVVYKLLAASVYPRPIAWVTTLDGNGGVNAAPYSFFNIMGSAPPTLALGLLADPDRGFKDTARNILETGEFVVNLVPEHLAEQMNVTAVDAPRGMDELALAGLTTAPSAKTRPPRIAESPVALECTALSSVVTGPCQTVVIGRIVAMQIDEAFVKDPARGHLHAEALDLVGRTHASGYVRTKDTFELIRPTWATFDRRDETLQPGDRYDTGEAK